MNTFSRQSPPLRPIVKTWLLLGVVMVFFQIVIGGITRLTGSGLSITKWEIVTGTIPPLHEAAWQEEFLKYQTTPQYKKINRGMSLAEFKYIYFWEYIHRLWARLMGFIFAVPFVIFWRKGWLSAQLIRHLCWVVFAAALAAIFGWIMVKSGLYERPWVNAYKLSIHLVLGFTVLGLLLWTVFVAFFSTTEKNWSFKLLRRYTLTCFILAFIQFFFGGIMSGMKAGLIINTWPDMHGLFIPQVLLNSEYWTIQNMKEYDKNVFAPALIQFIHRNLGYLVGFLSLYLSYVFLKLQQYKFAILLSTTVIIQILLGIFTLIQCVGYVPVLLGVLHQAGGVILLSILLYTNFLAYFDKL